MRKINMKRKSSRKEKAEQKNNDESDAGVEEESDPKDSGDEEPVSDEEESTENEPEPKKKKTDKRKSAEAKKKSSSKKNAGQEKEKAAEEDDDEDDAQYEVEEVIDEKMVKGVRHYLIRWKGYEPESDTWEPESTLQCTDLIKKFKASRKDQNGKENSDSSKKSRKKDDKKIKKREKKDKKGSSKSGSEVDWNSDDEFEVTRIIDVYFKRDGKREFLVSWKGYPSSQDSWEPEEHLDCHDMIAKFMSKVDAAKNVGQKELRVNRMQTERFTLNTNDGGRRLSRRHSGIQRVQYHDAE